MPTPSLTPFTPSPAAKPVKKTWRRLFKRIGFGIAGLVAILLIVFFLLPQWISNEQGRTYVLQQLNKRMRTKVAIGDWSLGWFRSTELRDVAITLPDNTTLFTSSRVKSELTLWSILWGNYDLGTTTFETPLFVLTKYADGTTSFDALSSPDPHQPSPLHKMLSTLRGAVQFSGGTCTFNSARNGTSLVYSDVKAVFTIASPDAPFHVQFEGVSPERTLSVATSFLPIRSWTAANWPQAIAASDFECSATNLPTALFCDWTTLDPRWQDSFGTTLADISLSNHAAPPSDASTLKILVHGSNGAVIDAEVGARALNIRTPALFSLGNAPGRHLIASIPISAPLAEALSCINPLFVDLQSGEGPVRIQVADLKLSSNQPADVQLSARLLFPPMTFKRASLAAELLKLSSTDATPSPTITASAEPFRLRAADGAFIYDSLALNFQHRQRISFRGAVRLDGRVDLMATVPMDSGWGGSALGALTAEVPITGTVNAPIVTLPH